jgi:hypothetical protein
LETTKIALVEGRDFDESRPSDKNAIIITETTCNLIGWTAKEAVGKRIAYIGDDVGAQEVIGVAKDFHLHSLRQNIFPFMFYNIHSNIFGKDRIALIRFKTQNLPGLVKQIERKWNQLSDAVPLSYSFYDEDVEKQYKQEQRLAAAFLIFYWTLHFDCYFGSCWIGFLFRGATKEGNWREKSFRCILDRNFFHDEQRLCAPDDRCLDHCNTYFVVHHAGMVKHNSG